MEVNKLAQAARDATQDMWDWLDIVTKKPRSEVGKAPKIDDIYNWQEYASKLRKAIGKARQVKDFNETSDNGGIQAAEVSPGSLEEAEAEWAEYVKLYPKLQRYSENDNEKKIEPTSPMAPIAISLPGQAMPGHQQSTAAGQVGVYQAMGVRDLTSIVNNLPLMKSNSTSSDSGIACG